MVRTFFCVFFVCFFLGGTFNILSPEKCFLLVCHFFLNAFFHILLFEGEEKQEGGFFLFFVCLIEMCKVRKSEFLKFLRNFDRFY